MDSTSLSAFKRCRRYYYYSILEGYATGGESVHLDFGTAAHKALEDFFKLRASGSSYDDALEETLVRALTRTWNVETNSPMLTSHVSKNRESLARLIVEYFDHYERAETGPRTVHFADGAPAVELSFAFDSGYTAGDEPVVLCGHMDRLVQIESDTYVADLKTTTSALGLRYAMEYSPNTQFTLYTIASRIALAQPAKGILLDAAQIGMTFVRFERYPIPRSQGILDEWMFDLRGWIDEMEACAIQASEPSRRGGFTSTPEIAYPQNDASCNLYGGCPFRSVCSRSPTSRQPVLDAEFTRRRWDPFGEPR